MSEDAYNSNTYIKRTRDRLYKILGRQPSFEEIQSQVIGLGFNELLDLLEHEIMNNLLFLAGGRDLVPEDIKKECKNWGLDDDEVEKLNRWASEAGLIEANTEDLSEVFQQEYASQQSISEKEFPSLTELIAVRNTIPDFKETVLVGKDEIIRSFRTETLTDIKKDFIQHRQTKGTITESDFEFELRIWSIPRSYVEELAAFVNSLNENGVLPQDGRDIKPTVKPTEKQEKEEVLLDEQYGNEDRSSETKAAVDIDDFEDDSESDVYEPDIKSEVTNRQAKTDEKEKTLESDELISLDAAYEMITDFCSQYSDIKTDSNITVLNVGDVKQINTWIEGDSDIADPIESIEIETGNSADVYILDELPFVKGRIAVRAKEKGVTTVCLNTESDNPLYIALFVI